jgi:hypothetical protein
MDENEIRKRRLDGDRLPFIIGMLRVLSHKSIRPYDFRSCLLIEVIC